MIDILFIIIFILIPILVVYILKLSNLNLFEVSLPSFIIASMFAMAYIGYFPLYFGLDDYRYSIGIDDKYIVFQAYCFSAWTIVSMSLGFLYTSSISKSKLDVKINMRYFYNKEKLIGFIVIVFCFFVLSIYISELSSVALVSALLNSASEALHSRSLMGNEFDNYHRYRWIMRDLFTIITLSFYANWLVTKRKLDFIIFLVAFFGIAFSLIMATEKGPFAWFIIGMFLVYCIIRNDSKIPIKAILLLLVFLISILVLFYIYFMGSKDIYTALISMFSRIFAGGITPSYFYLEFFPNQHDFLLGKSFPNPGGLMAFTPYNLTIEISNYMFPEQIKQGIVGTAPTVFWGELYANFGIIGPIVFPFFVGIIIYSISVLFNKVENTPFKVGFLVWLLLHYRTLSGTGISGFIIDVTLIIMLLLGFVFIMITNNLKLKYYKN